MWVYNRLGHFSASHQTLIGQEQKKEYKLVQRMTKKIEFIVASEFSGGRDRIGVEAYDSGELLLEVFRDDTQKRRYVTRMTIPS